MLARVEELEARITELEADNAALRGAVAAAPVVHADETGARVDGAGRWVHVAGTDTLTCYDVHPKRKREALGSFGVLPGFTGTLVTDALGSYSVYGAAHQLCGAHLCCAN